MKFFFSISLLVCWLVPHEALDNPEQPSVVRNQLILPDILLFVSTLNGTMYAITKKTGDVKWSMQDNPVVKAPLRIHPGGTFLPNPHDGTLYAYLGNHVQDRLRKLPYTIPELVRASPSRSSDGVLYVGRKQDVWHAIDPATGIKQHSLTMDGIESMCPPVDNKNKFFYMGRTEYVVSMFDGLTGKKNWNVTFHDYAASKMEKQNYDLVHFISGSSGRIITMDQLTGDISWENHLGSPIVGIYAWHPDGLQKTPVTVVAEETIDSIVSSSVMGGYNKDKELVLKPTLFVGKHNGGLYAIPTLVDENSVVVDPKIRLLEGPHKKNGVRSDAGKLQSIPLLHGYHTVPKKSDSSLLSSNLLSVQDKPIQDRKSVV